MKVAASPPALPQTPYVVVVDDREKLVYPLTTPISEPDVCPCCGWPHGDATDDAGDQAPADDPYTFAAPFRRGPQRKTFTIRTTRGHLATGDYSLAGAESRVTVERKSLTDLFSTLGAGRARFCRELERLAALEFAAVVVEAEWSEVLLAPPGRSRLDPKTIFHSVVAWTVRHPNVHWHFVPGRSMGEVTTARLLDWFHRERCGNDRSQ